MGKPIEASCHARTTVLQVDTYRRMAETEVPAFYPLSAEAVG